MHYLNSNLSCSPQFVGSEGPWLIDRHDRRFFDVWLGSGTLIFGHPSSSPDEEYPLAPDMLPEGSNINEEHLNLISCLVNFPIEAIGFQTGGSAAVSRACRLARACTGREKIAVVGSFWHGSDDPFLFKNGKVEISTGVPEALQSEVVWYKNVNEFLATSDIEKYAALIVEPFQGANPSVSVTNNFSKSERDKLRDNGVFLILDEVITGFRERFGSCNESRRLAPDIVVFGKALALGFPIGMVILSSQAPMAKIRLPFWGGTFAASPTQLNHVFMSLEKLNSLDYCILTKNLDQLNKMILSILSGTGYLLKAGKLFSRIINDDDANSGARGFITNDSQNKLSFNKILLNRGIYVGNNGLVFPSIFDNESCFAEQQ